MKLNLLDNMPTPDGVENEKEEEEDEDDNDIKNGNNGDSHLKNGGGDKVLDDDSNISVPISNASEVEEESKDSVKDDLERVDERLRRNQTGHNNGSAYNCIEDSKDGLCSDDNSRQQILTNGDNSNLSYSNLSSDDLNNSTAENTADNTFEAPTINTTILTPSATPLSTPIPTPPITTTNNNGHVGNGESCSDNHIITDIDNCDTKISENHKSENNSLDDNVVTNLDTISKITTPTTTNITTSTTAIKRPGEEITCEDNGSLDKKSRIE